MTEDDARHILNALHRVEDDVQHIRGLLDKYAWNATEREMGGTLAPPVSSRSESAQIRRRSHFAGSDELHQLNTSSRDSSGERLAAKKRLLEDTRFATRPLPAMGSPPSASIQKRRSMLETARRASLKGTTTHAYEGIETESSRERMLQRGTLNEPAHAVHEVHEDTILAENTAGVMKTEHVLDLEGSPGSSAEAITTAMAHLQLHSTAPHVHTCSRSSGYEERKDTVDMALHRRRSRSRTQSRSEEDRVDSMRMPPLRRGRLVHTLLPPTLPPGSNAGRGLAWNPSVFETPMIAVALPTRVDLWQRDRHGGKFQALAHPLTVSGDAQLQDVAWARNLGRSQHCLAAALTDGRVAVWTLRGAAPSQRTLTMLDAFDHEDGEDTIEIDERCELWRVSFDPTGTVLAASDARGDTHAWRWSVTHAAWRRTPLVSTGGASTGSSSTSSASQH
ncbi:MAG: hypothetical protein MHM6MM_000444 [Cercozoa sp. M6MM]